MWTDCRYDPDRLAREWKEARWLAIAPFIDSALRSKDEISWIHAVLPQSRELVLSALYEGGHELGKRVRKETGEELNLGDTVRLMNRAESPCFQGNWKSTEHGLARRLCRSHCPFVKGEFDCDYWREAARGIVSGLSDSVAFTRHESIGHQGEGCADILYQTPVTDVEYGPIPEEVREAVGHLVEDLNRWRESLELVGFQEGALYFKLVGEHYPECESCHRVVVSELQRALDALEPQAKLCELPSMAEIPGTGSKFK